jgi:hypothetical protein
MRTRGIDIECLLYLLLMSRSKYDDLHDHYHAILTTKAGTRYERLAAIVFAAMERDDVVIHDLKVLGSVSGVEHQIDIHIEKNGVAKRILVECKDFDVSGDPVGLGIVRDFPGCCGRREAGRGLGFDVQPLYGRSSKVCERLRYTLSNVARIRDRRLGKSCSDDYY